MIQNVPHPGDSRALAVSAGRPAARVAVLGGGPDGHQESHADGSRFGADLEPAFGFDLLNRLLAGKLLAVSGSIRVDVCGPVINDLRHLGLLDVQPYLRA